MGQELACTLQYRRRTLAGKAYLETEFVLFRGEERLKVPLKDLTAVEADGGVLKLEFPGGPAALDLGPAAEKWARKILHPPSLLDKLGVKPESAVALIGEFPGEFTGQLAKLAEGRSKADLVFFAANAAEDLARIPMLIARLKPGGALWVVYPKGVAAIREIEVIQAGRGAGLKDTKVASFSTTHTALRFVAPAASR